MWAVGLGWELGAKPLVRAWARPMLPSHTRGVLKGRDFFFLLRTPLKDRP